MPQESETSAEIGYGTYSRIESQTSTAEESTSITQNQPLTCPIIDSYFDYKNP